MPNTECSFAIAVRRVVERYNRRFAGRVHPAKVDGTHVKSVWYRKGPGFCELVRNRFGRVA